MVVLTLANRELRSVYSKFELFRDENDIKNASIYL